MYGEPTRVSRLHPMLVRLVAAMFIGLIMLAVTSCNRSITDTSRDRESAALKRYVEEMRQPEAAVTQALQEGLRNLAGSSRPNRPTSQMLALLTKATTALVAIEPPAGMRQAHARLAAGVRAWASSLRAQSGGHAKQGRSALRAELVAGAELLSDWQLAVHDRAEAVGPSWHAPPEVPEWMP